MKMMIFNNSQYVYENEAMISAINPGFMYGYGVFETIQVKGGRVIYLVEHYERMCKSLNKLNLDICFPMNAINDICTKLITENCVNNGFVKVICSLGEKSKPDLIIYTGSKNYLEYYEKGYKLTIAASRRNEHSMLSSIKSLNYMENIIEQKRAKDMGFDEAIFLNTKDFIAEGCVSNIFWVKKNKVFTPSLECGILPGIIREKVIKLLSTKNYVVISANYSIDDLYEADEIFITNSLMNIMPVSSFLDKSYNLQAYKLVKWLMEEMNRV